MVSHTTWPNKCIQIARVTSANMTHLTKILVNHKLLSNDIIDPLFLWYLQVGSVKAEPQWAKYPNWVLEVSWHPKTHFWNVILLQKWCSTWVAFLLALITLWAHAYPWDVLTTCCHHTCQGCGEGEKQLSNSRGNTQQNTCYIGSLMDTFSVVTYAYVLYWLYLDS
jgi:hypothetical protein